MTPKSKKIIAKEIIIFSLGLLILIGIIGSIWIYNRYKSKNKSELLALIDILKFQRDQFKLAEVSKEEVNPQKGDVVDFSKVEELPSLEDLENSGKQASFYDEIKDKYDIGTLPEFLERVSFSEKRKALYNQLISDGYNLGTFDQFSTKLGFVSGESLIASKNEIIKYHSKLTYLNKRINNYHEAISEINVMDSNELYSLFAKVTLILLIIIYPLRFLLIAILWALKTLRSK